MTTSSSDGGRCTRISPSAVLDDRMFGKDLEWARDHLRRCDTCRGRIEDFQEMVLRVERLPQAPVDSVTLEEAFLYAVPDAPRPVPSQTRIVAPAASRPPATSMPPLPPVTPEVGPAPDPFTDFEADALADARWNPEAGPAPLEWIGASSTPSSSAEEEFSDSLSPSADDPEWIRAAIEPAPVAELPVRSVEVDSARHPVDVADPGEGADGDPVVVAEQPSIHEEPLKTAASEQEMPASGRGDRVMRVAVGLGAAACVLLAALLYEGGFLGGLLHGSRVSAHASATASVTTKHPGAQPSVHPSVAPTPAPTLGTVLATLGDRVTGERVFRIRPGTAYSSYTRLVFDLTGTGLPAMVVTQVDPTHVMVTFKDTTGANVPVAGIHSIQVAGIEPAVQDGPDLRITVDLNRPVHVVEFTLPPGSGYAPRLVLDLHNQ